MRIEREESIPRLRYWYENYSLILYDQTRLPGILILILWPLVSNPSPLRIVDPSLRRLILPHSPVQSGIITQKQGNVWLVNIQTGIKELTWGIEGYRMIREKGRVRSKPTGQIQVNGHTFGGLELGRSSVGKVNIVGTNQNICVGKVSNPYNIIRNTRNHQV
jgi:hypothetical protein